MEGPGCSSLLWVLLSPLAPSVRGLTGFALGAHQLSAWAFPLRSTPSPLAHPTIGDLDGARDGSGAGSGVATVAPTVAEALLAREAGEQGKSIGCTPCNSPSPSPPLGWRLSTGLLLQGLSLP
eukprot:CAMPEP_0177618348 /NCGR_PEP_ID=MMETSP0419_2-20121207/25520_1 /TAXON_ID=582737 /ORGANISM="Tetraselmis sp., Strain GSL018" /LENGTH=122 /DNA_ID=CAMNT_0019117225 /DNA_START=46 /DNA_END=411 /DNA_ORIENTATION=-